MDASFENSLLQKKRIKETPIRLLVLRFFIKNNTAFSLKDIEDELFYSDKSTIFRTLKLFEKEGILHGIISSDGIKSYALCADDCDGVLHNDHHAHLKCKKCKSIFCIPVDLEIFNNLDKDYLVTDIQVYMNGICKDCNLVAET
ncbi:MAG: transcriptional repressor [Cellulophaga sp.]